LPALGRGQLPPIAGPNCQNPGEKVKSRKKIAEKRLEFGQLNWLMPCWNIGNPRVMPGKQ